MEEISPAVAVLLFLEDFTRENPSIRKGAKYFTWQKRYDSYEVAYSIVGATVVELLHGGYIDLEVKRGLLRKSVLFTRKRMIPKKYGVMGRGFNAISEYNPTPLNSALFLIFPISRFPAAYLGTYIVEKELKGKDPEELRKDSEMIKYKEELKVLLEDLKRNQPELWEGIKKEVDKACQLVRGNKAIPCTHP